MNVDQLVSAFLSLPVVEQDRFLKLIKGLKREESGKAEQGSAPFVLYERLSDALFRTKGVRLPAFPYLCKGTNGKALLEAAVRWLDADKMNKRERMALFSMAAEAAVDSMRDIQRNPRREEVLKIIADLPLCIEAALPGYKVSGFLPWFARGVATGQLTKSHRKD